MFLRAFKKFKRINYVMKKVKDIKICPKCGSTNFQPATGQVKICPQDFLLPPIDSGISNECKNCGYRGNFSEIKENLVANFQKKLSKK